MEEIYKYSGCQSPEKDPEIDLRLIAGKLQRRKWTIITAAAVGLFSGVVIALSLPREYTTDIVIAPENMPRGPSGTLGSLAAMAGYNFTGASSEQDVLSPDIYPDIVNSTPFLVELSRARVPSPEGGEVTVDEYVGKYLRMPWWRKMLTIPERLASSENGMTDFSHSSGTGNNPIFLSREEAKVVKELKKRVAVDINKKTGITTLSVMMQDPVISAVVADTLISNLKEYVTDYRTNKSREDLLFTEQLFADARENYYVSQKKYAGYADRNRHLILQSFRSELERLQNEMDLNFTVYSQTAQQLAIARARLQEKTPVFTVVEPAIVPWRPSAPGRLKIIAGMFLLGSLMGLLIALLSREKPGGKTQFAEVG